MFFAQCLVASGSNGYRELAFFNIAVPWAMFVMILPGLVGRPLLPMLAMAEMTPTHQLKIVRAAGGLMLAAAVMVAVPISAASPWIMGLYGNGYRTAWPVLVILTGGYAITWVAGVTDYIITARGNVWLSVSLNAVWGLVVVLCASFWKHDGALGLAWAVFAAFSTKAVFQLLYLYKFFLNANAFQATLDRAVNKQKLLKC
jgi:O-antigen/teichoic acid export membrane protein